MKDRCRETEDNTDTQETDTTGKENRLKGQTQGQKRTEERYKSRERDR